MSLKEKIKSIKVYGVVGVLLALMAIALYMLGYMDRHNTVMWLIKHNAPATALFLSNNDKAIYFDIGNYYFKGNGYDVDKAQMYFLKALEAEPVEYGLHYQLGRTYFIQGKFIEAITEIDKEIELFPENKKSYYIRGLIYGYMNNLDMAASDFREYLNANPDNWAGWNDLSWIYFRMGEYEMAADAARNGLTNAPGSAWLHNSLGVALLNLGDREGARISLEQALLFANRMTADDWGVAYPGNNPDIYEEGLWRMKESIEKNLLLLKNNSIK